MSKTKKTDQTFIDLTRLQELGDLGSGPAEYNFLKELIAIYEVQTRGTLSSIRSAVTDGDSQIAARLTHALKGSSSTIGARRLETMCHNLAGALSSEGDSDVPQLVERIEEALDRTVQELNNFVGTNK